MKLSRRLALALFLLPLSFFLLPPTPALAADCIGEDFNNCTTNSNYPFSCPGPQPGSNACCANQNACSDYLGVYASYAPWYRKSPPQLEAEKQTSPENEVNAPKFAASQFNYTIGELVGQTAMGKDSVLSGLGQAIAYMTTIRPVQTNEYLAYMAGRAGFIDQAHAQARGGFELLKPVQQIWIATRNIAYLITSLILVVIGFMIMLRKKIDAQTVIGVQQALPKLVVTLLLITFSYAIAGFVIDMIYFLIYFMINLASWSNIYSTSGTIKNLLTTRSAAGIMIRDIWWSREGTGAITNIFQELIGAITGEGQPSLASPAASLTGWLSQPVAWLIITGAILFAAFKLFFTLLMAYIQIIVGVIIGPLQLMLNALPGSDAFSKWFRNLLANAMAFPATATMLLLGIALMGYEGLGVAEGIGFTEGALDGQGFIPPLVGLSGQLPEGVVAINAIKGLIGLGIILMTPKVVDMVKEWVQAPEFKYGSAIGEAVGFGWGQAKGFAGRGFEATQGYNRAQQIARRELMSDTLMRHPEMAGDEQRLNALVDSLLRTKYPQDRGERLRRRFGKFLGREV